MRCNVLQYISIAMDLFSTDSTGKQRGTVSQYVVVCCSVFCTVLQYVFNEKDDANFN